MDAIHLHVSDRFLSAIAGEVFETAATEYVLTDRLSVADPLVAFALGLLAEEGRAGGKAELLYVDSLATHLCVHVLRHHTTMVSGLPRRAERLTPSQANELVDYIEANLASALTILELAGVIRTSPFQFAKVFKEHFGNTPHRYVTSRRLHRACELARKGNGSLKQIAAACGFYDHAHMTRVFRNQLGQTPSSFQPH